MGFCNLLSVTLWIIEIHTQILFRIVLKYWKNCKCYLILDLRILCPIIWPLLNFFSIKLNQCGYVLSLCPKLRSCMHVRNMPISRAKLSLSLRLSDPDTWPLCTKRLHSYNGGTLKITLSSEVFYRISSLSCRWHDFFICTNLYIIEIFPGEIFI